MPQTYTHCRLDTCGAELENGAQRASGFCCPAHEAAYGPEAPTPTWVSDIPAHRLGPYQSEWD